MEGYQGTNGCVVDESLGLWKFYSSGSRDGKSCGAADEVRRGKAGDAGLPIM